MELIPWSLGDPASDNATCQVNTLRHRYTPLRVLLVTAMLASCDDSTEPSRTEGVGINTAGGWSDSPFISGDGQRLYFMYSRYNFAPWILSGGAQQPVLAGP